MGRALSNYAINYYMAPPEWGFERFAKVVAASGAGGIGVTQRALDELPVARIKGILAECGLRVSGVNSAGYFLYDDPARAARQAAENERVLVAAAELGASAVVAIPGGLHGFKGSLEEARRRSEDGLGRLVERATALGVRVGLEPMHPLLAFERSTVNTLAHGAELALRHPPLGLTLDVFHSWWEPELYSLSAAAIDRVALVQLCNVDQAPDAARPMRTPFLGQGVFDVGRFVRHLAGHGFGGFFEFEIFPPHLAGHGVEAVVAAAVRDFAALPD